jgi:hypothetical protein
MTEGTAEALQEMLNPRVEISGIAAETDPEKVNALAFELYKEALSVVNLAAHLLARLYRVSKGWLVLLC